MKRRCQPWGVLLCAALLTGLPLAGQAEHVVGIFAPVTGAHAPIGRSLRNGVVLALEQAEDGGRFGEVRLSIRTLDDSGAPKAVAERVVKFVRDEMAILVIGPAISAQAEAAADLANHNRFPLLAPGTSEGITAKGKWSFRLSMNPYKTLHALAAYALTHSPAAEDSAPGVATPARVPGVRRLALVHAKGNRGYAAQAAEFRVAAIRAGAAVAGEFEADLESGLVAQTADAVRHSGADIVFFAMDAEPGAALAAALASSAPTQQQPPPAGVLSSILGSTRASAPDSATPARRIQFVFSPAAAHSALTRIGGAAVEGALTAADYLPEARTERNEQFRAAYRIRFGTDVDAWAGIGYAAGQVAAEAIRNAGPNPTPETVRLALERVNHLQTILGQSPWQQDVERNPTYAPQMYVLRAGRLVPVQTARAK